MNAIPFFVTCPLLIQSKLQINTDIKIDNAILETASAELLKQYYNAIQTDSLINEILELQIYCQDSIESMYKYIQWNVLISQLITVTQV